MIKENELKPTGKPGYRLRGDHAAMITLPIMQKLLFDQNETHFGLPLSINLDQIKSGGLFNSNVEGCLIITNVQHPNDYFRHCLTLRKQGKMATIDMRYYGQSALTGEMHRAEERGKKLSGMLVNAIKGKKQVAFDVEYEYYEMLEQMFTEAFQ